MHPRHRRAAERQFGCERPLNRFFADFVMNTSNFLLKACARDEIALAGEEQRLIELINRMRLFAPPDVVRSARRCFDLL